MSRIANLAAATVLGGAVLGAVANVSGAAAKPLHVLYTFTAGSDGAYPESGLIRDRGGNLYGTAIGGGETGFGTVFRLAPDGTETTLHSFQGGANDGGGPNWLARDRTGNLYGTTVAGGGTGCVNNAGCGTVFRLAADGSETVLHAFTGGSDGSVPTSLLLGKKGNLYGATRDNAQIFRIAPDGKKSIVFAFTGTADGWPPAPGLITDSAGNFYGVAENGGADGYGVVFKVSPDGRETVLYSFTGGSDGGEPLAGLIADTAGNLYGTTGIGGDENCYPGGCGTVFKLAPDGTLSVLYAFPVANDNAAPQTRLVMDGSGNLYGTTGALSGAVFRLAPDGGETVLHAFTGGSDGAVPLGNLIVDRRGRLYGTTEAGGSADCSNGCGVVFEIRE